MPIPMLVALVISGVLVSAAAFFVISSRRFRTTAAEFAAHVAHGPTTSRANPPDAIATRAIFNGAVRGDGLRAVRLTQDAEFRRRADGEWGPMPAIQHMGLGTCAFVWNARAPGLVVPSLSVIDAHVRGNGVLRANLFGAIPVANAAGPVVDRAEAMRYLAELPWAPDAVLGNPEVTWTEVDVGAYGAALDTPSGPVSVRLTLNAAGDFVEMVAMRPDVRPDGTEFSREWRGRYTDYDWIGGRRIPLTGEVGYVEDGEYWAYWRGRITSLALLR